MELSVFEKVIIDPNKINQYLLNVNHTDGYGKASFFKKHKFNDQQLIATLFSHLEEYKPINEIKTVFGIKYIIEGKVIAPDRFLFSLRSVWIKLHAENILNFVTAYPI